MKLLLFGVASAVVFYLFIMARREKPWPREGHGHTYFTGTSRQ